MRHRGFTLIELLVVIAIIAVLIALLVPAVQRVREAGAQSQCANNLHQLAFAAHGYLDANRCFPPGSTLAPGQASALLFLLPYLEQGHLYQQFDVSQNVYSAAANSAARIQAVPILLCPSDGSSGLVLDVNPSPLPAKPSAQTNYYANMGIHAAWQEVGTMPYKYSYQCGVFALDSHTRAEMITDGMSTTALFAEIKRGAAPNNDVTDMVYINAATWDAGAPTVADNPNNLAPAAGCATPSGTYNYIGLEYYRGSLITAVYTHSLLPNDKQPDCMRDLGAVTVVQQGHLGTRSYHTGGVNVALADGSVRFVQNSIDINIWKALGTRAGGESVPANE